MSKFKAGDKVRAIRRKDGFFNRAWLTEGQVYTVERADNNTVIVYSDKYAMTGGFKHEDFELVTDNNERKESELERLVRVANEGIKALAQIRNSSHNTQVIVGPCPADISTPFEKFMYQSVPAHFSDGVDVFHIKPKPAFEPFTVGSGWQVKLEGETLHIGCQSFNVKDIKRGLTLIRTSSVFNFPGMKEQLHSYRFGVGRTDRSGPEISWEDADKILAALEQAGIK